MIDDPTAYRIPLNLDQTGQALLALAQIAANPEAPTTAAMADSVLKQLGCRPVAIGDQTVLLPPRMMVVEIDETEFLCIPSHLAGSVKSILSVYIYDANERTFICSATPNYRLRWVQYEVDWTDNATEDSKEEFLSWLDDVPGEDDYFSCSDIDKISGQRYFGLVDFSDLSGETDDHKMEDLFNQVRETVTSGRL